MARPTLIIALLLLTATAVAPGCSYKRSRINENLLGTELPPFVVGETTIEQALDALGPPAITDEFELFDRFLLYPRHLRYVVADNRTDELIVLPSWIIGVNRSDDKQPDRELLLLFDLDGVLSHAWLGGTRSVFPITQGRDSRERDEIRAVFGGEG